MPPVKLDFGWANTTEFYESAGETWPYWPNRYTNPVTDLGLGGAIGRFNTVWSINLSYCHQITNAGLATIGEGCPNLKCLNFFGCDGHADGLTDAGLATIIAGCPNLESLNLGCCTKITSRCWLGDDRRGLPQPRVPRPRGYSLF